MNTHHPKKRAARWVLSAVAAAAAAGVVQFASTAIAAADDDTTDTGSAPSTSSKFDMTPVDPPSATFTPSQQPAGGLTGPFDDQGDLVGLPRGPINVERAPVAPGPPEDAPSPELAPNVGGLFTLPGNELPPLAGLPPLDQLPPFDELPPLFP